MKLPLSKLCAVPFALQNRALFEEEAGGEKEPTKGEEEGWPAKGSEKEKRTRKNRSEFVWAFKKLLATRAELKGTN